MSRQWRPFRHKNRIVSRRCALAGVVLAGIAPLAPNAVLGQEKPQKDASKDKEISATVQGPDTDAGLILSARATAKEVGLPIYPGAIPHKEEGKEDDSPALKMG